MGRVIRHSTGRSYAPRSDGPTSSGNVCQPIIAEVYMELRNLGALQHFVLLFLGVLIMHIHFLRGDNYKQVQTFTPHFTRLPFVYNI